MAAATGGTFARYLSVKQLGFNASRLWNSEVGPKTVHFCNFPLLSRSGTNSRVSSLKFTLRYFFTPDYQVTDFVGYLWFSSSVTNHIGTCDEMGVGGTQKMGLYSAN